MLILAVVMSEFCEDTNPLAKASPGRKRARQRMRQGASCAMFQKGAGQEKRRVTMKEKPNYAELEKQIDFNALVGRLDKLTDKDNHQRTTLVTLLDNVKEQLLEAHQKRQVSYRTLAKELTDGGLKVSEPTLRKYMQAQGIGKRNRKKGRKATSNGHAHSSATAESKTPATATSQAQGEETRSRKHRFNLNL
jgi:hypothetical protein